MYINGEPTQQEITWQQDGDVTYAEMEVEVDEADEVVVYHEETVPGDEETSYNYMTLVTEVVEEDGVVITYQVEGNSNEYSIVIR